ncbi:MAG: hypothetical protein QOF45_2219 [Gaiellaceae bacterium]|jgi:hypothetical protein|nr:hypothetical protein [Gaiellaceae bacterium]
MDWTWTKRLRVWEANRKVVLYPENYVEPELRGDDDAPPPSAPQSRLRRRRRPKTDADK